MNNLSNSTDVMVIITLTFRCNFCLTSVHLSISWVSSDRATHTSGPGDSEHSRDLVGQKQRFMLFRLPEQAHTNTHRHSHTHTHTHTDTHTHRYAHTHTDTHIYPPFP